MLKVNKRQDVLGVASTVDNYTFNRKEEAFSIFIKVFSAVLSKTNNLLPRQFEEDGSAAKDRWRIFHEELECGEAEGNIGYGARS